MPKKKKQPLVKEAVVKRRKPSGWSVPAALAKSLSAHERWPDLKARDWQVVS